MKSLPMPENGDRVLYSDNLAEVGKVIRDDDPDMSYDKTDDTWQTPVRWTNGDESLEQLQWNELARAWRTT